MSEPLCAAVWRERMAMNATPYQTRNLNHPPAQPHMQRTASPPLMPTVGRAARSVPKGERDLSKVMQRQSNLKHRRWLTPMSKPLCAAVWRERLAMNATPYQTHNLNHPPAQPHMQRTRFARR